MRLLLLVLLVLFSAGCGGSDPVAVANPPVTPDFLGRSVLGPGAEGLLELVADPDGDLRGKLTVQGEGGSAGLRPGSYDLIGRRNLVDGSFVLQNAESGSQHVAVVGHARPDELLRGFTVLNDGQVFAGWLRRGALGAPRSDIEPRPAILSEVSVAPIAPRQLDEQLDGTTDPVPVVPPGNAGLVLTLDPGTSPPPAGVTEQTVIQNADATVTRTSVTPDAQVQQAISTVSGFLQGELRASGPDNFVTFSESVTAPGVKVRFRQWAPRPGSEVNVTVTRSDASSLEFDLEAPEMVPDPSLSPNDARASFSFKTHIAIPR